jgi:hypothetical protein
MQLSGGSGMLHSYVTAHSYRGRPVRGNGHGKLVLRAFIAIAIAAETATLRSLMERGVEVARVGSDRPN